MRIVAVLKCGDDDYRVFMEDGAVWIYRPYYDREWRWKLEHSPDDTESPGRVWKSPFPTRR